MACVICGKETGGLYTNGDGYGDGQHVGIDAGPLKHYCWEHADQAPDLAADINDGFRELGLCGFLDAWVGRCRNKQPCSKHESQTCVSCGERATHSCDETGQ